MILFLIVNNLLDSHLKSMKVLSWSCKEQDISKIISNYNWKLRLVYTYSKLEFLEMHWVNLYENNQIRWKLVLNSRKITYENIVRKNRNISELVNVFVGDSVSYRTYRRCFEKFEIGNINLKAKQHFGRSQWCC